MRTRHPFCAVVVVVALVAAACGGGGDGDEDDGEARATTTLDASSTTTAGDDEPTTTTATEPVPSTTAGEGEGFGDLEGLRAAAAAALLTPAEIGAGFVDGGYQPGDQADVTPCGTPGADTVVTPTITVGAQAAQASPSATVVEEIRIYIDPEEAATAYAAGVAGLSCPSGEEDGGGATVTFTGLGDLTDELGGTETAGWTFESDAAQGLLVAARLDAALVFFQFLIPAGTDAAALPDPLAVAGAAVAKVAAS